MFVFILKTIYSVDCNNNIKRTLKQNTYDRKYLRKPTRAALCGGMGPFENTYVYEARHE